MPNVLFFGHPGFLHRNRANLVVLILYILIAIPVLAQPPYDKLTKFTGSQNLGQTEAINGEVAFVGAPLLASPACYIYHFNGSFWEEKQILNGPANSGFAASLDIDGNYAIIADRLDDASCPGDAGCNSGAAYLYKFDGVQWNLLKMLYAEDAASQNFFGFKVAIDGDIAVVTAQNDSNDPVNGNNYQFQGSVYIFQRDAGGEENWGQVAKFKSADIAVDRQDQFGRSLDVSGDYVLVGSNNTDSGTDQNGSAYIYYRHQNGDNQWGRQTILKPVAVGPEGGNFGLDLALDGDVIAVGDNSANQEDDQGNTYGGSVTIFRRQGTGWPYESRIFHVQYGPFCVDRDNIVIAPITAIDLTVYFYRFADSQWSEKTTIAAGTDFNISGAIALSGVTLIAGDQNYLPFSGAAYFIEFIATPGDVSASDGTYLNRTVVRWKNRSDLADGFRIYRDHVEIGSALSVATTYNDYDAVPGKLQTYEVSAYNNTWNESNHSRSDLGWTQARGDVRGTVQTDQGAGIKDVEISFTDKTGSVGTYLSFDGVNDYIQLPYLPRNNPMTISAWIRSTANTDQQIVGWGSSIEESTIEFKLFPGGHLAYAEWNGSDWSPVTSDRAINDGTWHFVCVTISNDSCTLYIDGQADKTGTGFSRDITVTTTSIGAYDRGFAVQQFFQGDIDDVRLWNVLRSAGEIQSDMFNSLGGNETGLVGYWTFDDSTRSGASVAADYTHDGGHHGTISGAQWQNGSRTKLKRTYTDADGKYRIKNFYFEDDKEFRITPFKEKHLFDPEYMDMAFEDALGSSADFTDTTSFTLSGRIVYTGTSCPVEGVELMLNDDATGVFTDADGEYALAIEEPGMEYTLKPALGDSDEAHHFEPAGITLTVEDDVENLDFTDIERQLLYGKVRGGCIAGLGVAHIRVSSLNNPACFDTTLVTDFNGNYRVFLPAQEYLVDLTAIDYPDSADILKFFAAEQIDLRYENHNKNFIYHPPPIIQLTIFPDERTCDSTPVPIMAQSIHYPLLIEVLEAYGTDTCYVSGGELTIYDDVGGNPADPVILPISNGKANYTVVPGVPNILGGGEHPYQKLLQIKADVDGRINSLDQWVLVTGHRPRTPTFASTTPELPLMILRDPPGDQSSCFLSRGSSFTYNYTQEYDSSSSGSPGNLVFNYLDLQLGVIVSVGAGTTIDLGGYFKITNNWFSGSGIESTEGNSINLSTYEEFRTSENESIIGAPGDVFIGASLNQIYALTDILKYDRETCRVIRDTSLAVQTTGFNTTYIYTENHIRNTVIPQLTDLRDLSQGDSALIYENAISVWQQVLEQNETLKKDAIFAKRDPNLPDSQYLENNISFSGGTNTSYYTTIQTDSFCTIKYKQLFEKDLINAVGIVTGVTNELGFEWKWQVDSGDQYDSTRTGTNTIGYTLGDDDDGDFFSVDVKHDPVFGTPVFDLVAGTSSCPWEEGTQPRDGVQLGIDKFVQDDVPPGEPASFTLYLGNTSESGEARPYDLRMVQLSNPDGALIKVGGVPMGDALSYYIPAGDSSYQATLTVERGPRAYDYDNLQLMMVPPCEYDAYNSATSFADTVTFSVHFASPLSNASLTYPAENWEIGPADPDSMPIVINDYNSHNDYLHSLKLQYRKPEGSWATAFEISKDSLPEQNLKHFWHFPNLEDGSYQLRVASDGGPNGIRYSPQVEGRIERNAMLVSGTPEPADRTLNIEDQISIRFAENINFSHLDADREVSLIDADDSTRIDFTIGGAGQQLIIRPKPAFSDLGSRQLIARVINIEDSKGNRLHRPVSWRFKVDQHTLYWKSFITDFRIPQGQQSVQQAVLYNAGSEAADYQIGYKPAWLTISPADLAGSIAAKTERHLTFSCDTKTASGILDDSLVTILDGQRIVLYVSLAILNAPPAWSLVSNISGNFTTQVYARLVLDGQVSTDELDLAGVFIGKQLAGMGHIRKDPQTSLYTASFPVYFSAAQGGTLEFHLWDASQGKEYRYYNDAYRFSAGVPIGNPADPVIIEPNESFQSIAIHNGWNWISFNVASGDLSLDRVLTNYKAEPGDLIKDQFAFSEFTKEGGWTGSLHALRPETGYRLFTANAKELLAAGRPASQWASPAPLAQGWNWAGYLPEKPLAVKDALYFMQAVPGDKIKTQDQSAVYNNNGEWLGTLHELNPGQGYLLFTQANTELVYPDLKKERDKSSGYPEKEEWQVDAHQFESSMTLIGSAELAGLAYGDTTLIIAAFKAGQCRGVSKPKYVPYLDRYISFMMIYGNPPESGDSIAIKVYDPATGTTRDVEQILNFETEAHLGHPAEPFILNAMQTDAERIPAVYYLKQNYPNPFNPLTTIEYGLPADGAVSVTIYNVLGQKVSVLVDKKQTAGRYKIQFDAGKLGLASGVYFYQIRSQSFVKSLKMLLLK